MNPIDGILPQESETKMSNDMFSTRDVPWGKVGTVIEHDVTSGEATQIAGLDFEVLPMPAGYQTADKKTWRRAPGRVALVRQDTGKVFNYATKDYQPVPYAEAFEFMDEINPRFVAAGALRGGRQGFMVVELPKRETLMLKLRGIEDPHQLYVVLRTSQDLSHGIEILLMTLRMRCMNQLTLRSFGRGAKQMWSIRHTRNVIAKMNQAKDVILAADAYEAQFKQIAERLADIDLDLDQAETLLHQVLPDRPTRDQQTTAILDGWMNADTVGFPGTGWGLTNAVDEYFEYNRSSRGRTEESRFTDGLDGAAHRYTNRTAQLILS